MRYWAPYGWLDGRWQEQVVLNIRSGRFTSIAAGVPRADVKDALILDGPVMPTLVNAHSHAFQRVFAGLAEIRNSPDDDFWSWREKMYAVALNISPEHLRAIAAQLFVELLAGGYTHTCEFHYLHHAPDGKAYADPYTMAWAIRAAADDVGVGTTLLPVLYAHAGLRSEGLRPEQRRFKADADWVVAAFHAYAAQGNTLHRAGVALHSVRAAHAQDCRALVDMMRQASVPIHIHVSEQTAEVAESIAVLGAPPIAWLHGHVGLDARWHLVHATHATSLEIDLIAQAQAGVVLCPTTEANLGDGLTDGLAWRDAAVRLTLGSDSHVCRDWAEEIRLFEYGQRLKQQQRNVGATPPALTATADAWFGRFLAGSAQAGGWAEWGFAPGARADFAVLEDHAVIEDLAPRHWLSARVFGGHRPAPLSVYVAGVQRLQHGQHPQGEAIQRRFREALRALC